MCKFIVRFENRYLNARNFDHEHSSTQHVPSVVCPKFYTHYVFLFVEVNRFDFVHAGFQIRFCVQHLFSGYVTAKPCDEKIFQIRVNYVIVELNTFDVKNEQYSPNFDIIRQ